MKSAVRISDNLGYALKLQIEKAFKDKYVVERIADYDKDYFIFIAKPKTNMDAKFNTTYALNKNNGKIAGFAPSGDFEKFFDAMENGVVYPE